jgi:glycosyltransferase involved in cell wall biosynthesis/MoaA/NifB/PqqE/SkfB family radical SAM enzyme
MHILKVIHGYPPSYNAGSEVYSKNICQHLALSHRVSVVTREENPFRPCYEVNQEDLSGNLRLFKINNPQGKDGYRHKGMDAVFKNLVIQLKPDVAHIGHLNHLSTGFIDILKKLEIPTLFTLHDFWLMCPRGQFLTRGIGSDDNFQLCAGQEDNKCATSCYKVYHSGLEESAEKDEDYWTAWVSSRMSETRKVMEKVDRFIAPSKYLMNRFIEDFNVPAEKISYLDYGFPPYLKPVEKSSSKTPFTFGYIGTHIPAKGVNLLIEAFNKLDSDVHLRIYGRDIGQPTQSLKRLAESAGARISFMGEYDNENIVKEVFEQVDCIVVPSIWAENSPLVIHEAQACRVPVITADFGGMAEYVEHGVNGLLFEHRSVSSLTNQMTYAALNPQVMRALGQRGYLNHNNGKVPTLEEHCSELERHYKSVLSAKPSGLWRITLDTNPEDCNLNCIMCEEHSKHSDFINQLYENTGIKRRRMPFTTVERIFSQAAELGVKEIIPSTMGEPLLYKQIEGIFKLSETTGIKINLTTNGTFPKKTVEEWAEIIVPNTTDVKISWNGSTQATSESIMEGLDFKVALKKLRDFVRHRDRIFQQTGNYCSVTLQLTFIENNMHELAEIVKLAAGLNIDRVKGHHLWAHFAEIKELDMRRSDESIRRWNDYVDEARHAAKTNRRPNGKPVRLENIEKLSGKGQHVVPEDHECPFLGRELWVSATGKISPCCAPDDLRQQLGDFGNIGETSIQNVFQSEQYQKLCRDYKSRSLCSNCTMRKPIA